MGTAEGAAKVQSFVPCWEYRLNTITIPVHVAQNIRYPIRHPRRPVDRIIEGSISTEYRALQDGDVVLVICPPTLWEASAQIMRVALWNDTAIGLYPGNCAYYNADFDGDEIQIYPVTYDPIQHGEHATTLLPTT